MIGVPLSNIAKQCLYQYRCYGSPFWHRNRVVLNSCKQVRGLSEKRITNTTSKNTSSSNTSTTTTTPNNAIITTSTNVHKNSGQNDTISIIFSNAGLVFMGIAYMNEDMANFRLVAFGRLAMSMVAQHKLKQSFLFRWNALFLGINMAWILKSHLHVREEIIMTEDIQEAYNLLQEQGNFLSQNQARELFRRGQKQTWKRGNFLISEGFPCKELFFIESGTGVIVKQGYVMGMVKSGDFLHNGDLTQWTSTPQTKRNSSHDTIQRTDTDDDDPKDDVLHGKDMSTTLNSEKESWSHPNVLCQESIVIDSESMILWTWDQDEINALDQAVKNALLAHMYAGTQDRLRQAWTKSIQHDEEMARLQHIATEYLLDGIMVPKKNKS